MPADAESLLEQAKTLDSQRAPWEGLWSDCRDICFPFSEVQGHHALANQAPDRSRLGTHYDSTARKSLDTLTLGCSARITPSGSRWFQLRPPASIAHLPAAVAWYHRCSEILFSHLAPEKSNFYQIASLHYRHRGGYGTAATQVLEAKNRSGLVFRSYPLGTYSIAQNQNGEVDTFALTMSWKPGDILKEFPSAPEAIRKLHDEPSTRHIPVQFKQIILPREDRDPRKSDARNKPFASIYIYPPEKLIIGESGFEEFPTAVSRWEPSELSPYGIPPSAYALPEASQASFLEQMLDTLAETAAFPRVLYTGQLKGDIDFASMGLTCWDPTAGEFAAPREWLTGGRYDIGKDRTADKRRIIEDAFHVPLFNTISRLPKPDEATATAIRALVGESLELFHPIFANTTGEFLVPILRRSWAILLRQGAFPPPPAAVVQSGILGDHVSEPAVEFTSAMALALEQGHLSKLNDALAVLGNIAAIDASVLDFIDTDELGPDIFRVLGLPAAWIRDPEVIAALRQQRAQLQQAATAREAAGAVRDLGGAQGIQQLQQLSS